MCSGQFVFRNQISGVAMKCKNCVCKHSKKVLALKLLYRVQMVSFHIVNFVWVRHVQYFR